jgi:hypothetical protein
MILPLILKRAGRAERWEHQERGDYNLDRFDQEFRERLYSERGREILRSQSQSTTSKVANAMSNENSNLPAIRTTEVAAAPRRAHLPLFVAIGHLNPFIDRELSDGPLVQGQGASAKLSDQAAKPHIHWRKVSDHTEAHWSCWTVNGERLIMDDPKHLRRGKKPIDEEARILRIVTTDEKRKRRHGV